jgi:hypothetical protein
MCPKRPIDGRLRRGIGHFRHLARGGLLGRFAPAESASYFTLTSARWLALPAQGRQAPLAESVRCFPANTYSDSKKCPHDSSRLESHRAHETEENQDENDNKFDLRS